MSEYNNIVYDDEKHTYTLDGKVLTSVTQIASEICNIKPQYYKAGSAAKGTDVHSELGRYYDPSDTFSAADFTIDTAAKMALFLKAEPTMRTEVIVWNSERNYAGTIDLLSINGNKIKEIVDFKSGSVNKKYCTVQLSLYKLALESMGYDVSECRCRIISPKGITLIDTLDWKGCWDLQKSELDPINVDKINAMEKRMAELLPYVNEYKEIESQFRAELLEQLEVAGATQYDGSLYTVSYTRPTTRISVDTTRLKAERPDIYQEFLKETSVGSSVKLTIKE